MENSTTKQKTTKAKCRQCFSMVYPSKKYCKKHRYQYIVMPGRKIWNYIDHYSKKVLEYGRLDDGSSIDLLQRIGEDGSITRPSDKIFQPPSGYYII